MWVKLEESMVFLHEWNFYLQTWQSVFFSFNTPSLLPSLQVDEVDESLLKQLAYNARGDICPMQGVIGGITAQEVMKVCVCILGVNYHHDGTLFILILFNHWLCFAFNFFRHAVESSAPFFSFFTMTVWNVYQKKETSQKLHANLYDNNHLQYVIRTP